jgi:dienelactone hydrolase
VSLLLWVALVAQDPAWEKIKPFFAPPAELAGQLGDFKPVLRFDDGRPVQTAAQWAERRRELLKQWHERLGPWPPMVEKPTIETLGEEHVENFTRRRVRVQVAPDRTTEGYLLVPDMDGPFPAIVDVFYQPNDGAGITAAKRGQNDFGYQMARVGFVALCIGQDPGLGPDKPIFYPSYEKAQLQPLSYLAYVAATARAALATLPSVDPKRIGIVGHSYGGKWAMFAAALHEPFTAVCISDPGIVFDEARPNVNYWEPWYLGYEAGATPRGRGVVTDKNPRTGPYKKMIAERVDLHELHALIAPRPFFVLGGSEDGIERWRALNHAAAVCKLLGVDGRVGLSTRPGHAITPEANEQFRAFFEHFLKR